MAKPEGDEESLSSVYSSSLQCYVEDVLRSSEFKDNCKQMNNEWARYISFKTFPLSSPVQPIKLAKAGFFYTGQGDETNCFSCGLRKQNWKSEESALEVHKRLSPDCNFVKGTGVCDTPIHRCANGACRSNSNSDTNTTNSQGLESGKRSEEQFGPFFTNETGELRTPHDAQGQISPTNTTDRLWEETNISRFAERQNKSPDRIQSRGPEFSSTTTTPDVQTEGIEPEISILEPTNQKAMKQDIKHFEINVEKSKHPHYSVLRFRLESFRGWPTQHAQKPADLTAAGFYYVGVGDCVRCFFCGGGLRSWEQSDDPWKEHARWYPDCDFLKQCKGEDFVLGQLAGIHLRSEEPLETEPHHTETSEMRFGDEVCNIISETTVGEATSTHLMDSPAVQSILSMGYSLVMVRQANQMLESRKGKSKISADSLMEVIFEIEEAESTKQSKELDTSNDVKQSLDEMMREDDRVKANNEQKDNRVSPQDNSNYRDEEKNRESPKGSLWPEEQGSLLEQTRKMKDQMTCKICMDREACIVFLPCCHMMACPQCAPALRKCPVCRQLVKGTVRAYIS